MTTTPQDIQAALDYNAKAIENAEILVSHNIREAKDEAKAVLKILKTIRSALQSHAKDIENPTNLCMSEKHIQKNQENYTGARDIQAAIRFFENPAVKMDRLTRMHYEVLKEAAQSHAPAHDAGDLEALKLAITCKTVDLPLPDGVDAKCRFPYHKGIGDGVIAAIDHLAPRLARSEWMPIGEWDYHDKNYYPVLVPNMRGGLIPVIAYENDGWFCSNTARAIEPEYFLDPLPAAPQQKKVNDER